MVRANGDCARLGCACVAVVQHASRPANFRDLFDREQHTRFVVRPHERRHGGLIRDASFQVGPIQQALAVNRQVGDAVALGYQGRICSAGVPTRALPFRSLLPPHSIARKWAANFARSLHGDLNVRAADLQNRSALLAMPHSLSFG